MQTKRYRHLSLYRNQGLSPVRQKEAQALTTKNPTCQNRGNSCLLSTAPRGPAQAQGKHCIRLRILAAAQAGGGGERNQIRSAIIFLYSQASCTSEAHTAGGERGGDNGKTRRRNGKMLHVLCQYPLPLKNRAYVSNHTAAVSRWRSPEQRNQPFSRKNTG